MSAERLRLRQLLERLVKAEIEFVLVGGLAVNAWGYVRATRDIDIVPGPSAENIEKLDKLLTSLDGRVDVNGQLLAGGSIRTFLRAGDRTLVLTELGQVDVLQGLPQVPRFEVLSAQATEVNMDGLVVRVCSLEHLMGMKRASDRPRDRDDLEALEKGRGKSD